MDARQTSLRQAENELDVSVIDAEAFTEEDQARAHSVALALTGGFGLTTGIGLATLLLLRQGSRDPIRRALAQEDYRLRRVAATEVPHAYSRMHYEIDPGEGWARRWDATLDLRLCKTCRKMHGIIVPIGEPFPGGMVPGDVHPNCRCEPAFVPIALLKAA